MRIYQSRESSEFGSSVEGIWHSFRNKVKNKKKSMRISLSSNDPSYNFNRKEIRIFEIR